MENWEKKEGKVNLKRVFNPPFDGHIPHGTSCRRSECLGQEQAHEMGMIFWGGSALPSCTSWDIGNLLGDSAATHRSLQPRMSHHLDPISQPVNLGAPSPLELLHHSPGVTLIYVSLHGAGIRQPPVPTGTFQEVPRGALCRLWQLRICSQMPAEAEIFIYGFLWKSENGK